MILWPSKFTFWKTERFDSCAIIHCKWQMTKLHCKWLDSALNARPRAVEAVDSGACSGDDGRYWLGIGSFQTRCFPILSCMSLGRPFDQDRFEEAWWIPSQSSFVFHVSKMFKETGKDLKLLGVPVNRNRKGLVVLQRLFRNRGMLCMVSGFWEQKDLVLPRSM